LPDLPARQLVARFRAIESEIHVLRTLRGLNISTKEMGQRKNVILSFSPDGQLDLFTFAKGADALRAYFQLETDKRGSDIVLVKGDTGADIRLAYKNYFSDPDDFVRYVERGCSTLTRRKKRRRRVVMKRRRRPPPRS
jgi:hypothetical protein